MKLKLLDSVLSRLSSRILLTTEVLAQLYQKGCVSKTGGIMCAEVIKVGKVFFYLAEKDRWASASLLISGDWHLI